MTILWSYQRHWTWYKTTNPNIRRNNKCFLSSNNERQWQMLECVLLHACWQIGDNDRFIELLEALLPKIASVPNHILLPRYPCSVTTFFQFYAFISVPYSIDSRLDLQRSNDVKLNLTQFIPEKKSCGFKQKAYVNEFVNIHNCSHWLGLWNSIFLYACKRLMNVSKI